MLIQMVVDVFHILVINAFFLFALTFGTYTLYNSLGTASASDSTPLPDACEDFERLGGTFHGTWPYLFFVLLNGMVSGDNHAGCFAAAGEDWFGWLAWFYSYFFLVSTAILLLNMLIAMMVSCLPLNSTLEMHPPPPRTDSVVDTLYGPDLSPTSTSFAAGQDVRLRVGERGDLTSVPFCPCCLLSTRPPTGASTTKHSSSPMVRRLGHSTTCNAFTSKWIGSAPVSKLCGTSSHFRLWLLSIHDAHVACRYQP